MTCVALTCGLCDIPVGQQGLEDTEDCNPRRLRGTPWTSSDSDPEGPSQCAQAQHTARGAYLSFPIWSSSALWPRHPASHLESPHGLNLEPEEHLPGPYPPIQRPPAYTSTNWPPQPSSNQPFYFVHLSQPFAYLRPFCHTLAQGSLIHSLIHSFTCQGFAEYLCVRRSSWCLIYISE